MAGITLAQAQAKLTGWMSADDALQSSQEYSMGSRKLTRADSKEIRENIIFWNEQVNALSRSGRRIIGGTPC